MNISNVLVIGGAGFIGSHVNERLHAAGYSTVVLDNLSSGHPKAVLNGHFVCGDLGDTELLGKIFEQYNINIVMHFAALIDVGESVRDPGAYYNNNVVKTLQLLHTMVKYKVNKIIFSSTAAIFGLPQELPVKETHPTQPINPYGRTKLMVETILRDFDTAYGIKYCCLRYFNAAGGDPSGKIKNYKTKESNLIPVALRSLKQPDGTITIFGTDYPTKDGTCVRDYIHIYDLASAHILAMEKLLYGAPSSHYNLGNGQGFTVREVLNAIKEVTKRSLKIIEGPRREGDSYMLVADSQKARTELGWSPRYADINTIVAHAWQALKPLESSDEPSFDYLD